MGATPHRHRSVVVFVRDARASDQGARELAASLGDAGIEIRYLGAETSVRRRAESVVEVRADAVEVCLAGRGRVALLRDLLRELHPVDRHEVSLVVHRVQ
jgi:methylmalonyl-CoA mutase cobalamin-binding subunit